MGSSVYCGALLSFIVLYYWLLVCTFAVQLLREEPSTAETLKGFRGAGRLHPIFLSYVFLNPIAENFIYI